MHKVRTLYKIQTMTRNIIVLFKTKRCSYVKQIKKKFSYNLKNFSIHQTAAQSTEVYILTTIIKNTNFKKTLTIS